MDSFSFGAELETYGLAGEFVSEIDAKSGVAFDVGIFKHAAEPPARFRNGDSDYEGMPTLLRCRREFRVAPIVTEAQTKAKHHNEIVATRVHKHTELVQLSADMLRAKLELTPKSLAAAEAKAKAEAHNKMVAEKHRLHAEAVARGEKQPGHPTLDETHSLPRTPTTATPPKSPCEEHEHHEHHMHTPIKLKTGGKLLYTSVPCKYHGSAKGCRMGEDCMYSHSDPHFIAPCKHFAAGHCDHGDECFFRHTDMHIPQMHLKH